MTAEWTAEELELARAQAADDEAEGAEIPSPDPEPAPFRLDPGPEPDLYAQRRGRTPAPKPEGVSGNLTRASDEPSLRAETPPFDPRAEGLAGRVATAMAEPKPGPRAKPVASFPIDEKAFAQLKREMAIKRKAAVIMRGQ